MAQKTNKGGKPIPNGPSTTGNKSGSGRGNNSSKTQKQMICCY